MLLPKNPCCAFLLHIRSNCLKGPLLGYRLDFLRNTCFYYGRSHIFHVILQTDHPSRHLLRSTICSVPAGRFPKIEKTGPVFVQEHHLAMDSTYTYTYAHTQTLQALHNFMLPTLVGGQIKDKKDEV